MLPVYLSLQIWKSFLGQSVSPILSNVCPQNICFVQTLQVGVAVPRVPVPALVHHLNQRLHPRHGRHLQIRPCVPVSFLSKRISVKSVYFGDQQNDQYE